MLVTGVGLSSVGPSSVSHFGAMSGRPGYDLDSVGV